MATPGWTPRAKLFFRTYYVSRINHCGPTRSLSASNIHFNLQSFEGGPEEIKLLDLTATEKKSTAKVLKEKVRQDIWTNRIEHELEQAGSISQA